MKQRVKNLLFFGIEVFLLALLAITTWFVGIKRLETWNGPAGSLTNDLFVPAIMMNASRGFTNIEPADIPQLRAFLDFREQTFDAALIQPTISIIPLHPYQEYHRYLIYSVALAWRLLGISWEAIKYLILFYLILAVGCVYALSRLAMRPILAFAVSLGFLYAQAVLWTLPIIRDFAKAPFILGLLFILGMTVRFRLTKTQYVLLAIATGVLLGVGIGFRRDMMVFVPISLVILFLCKLKSAHWDLLLRIFSCLAVLFFFFTCGAPVHRALYRDGYVAAHDTIMGFASFSDHELGVLTPASYEKQYLLNDLFCTLKAHDAAKRGLTFPEEVYKVRCNEPEFDLEMKQAYVLLIWKTFPADMLTRAYAAVLRMATAIINSQYAVPRFFEKTGIWFMVGALLLVAARHPFEAWLMVLLLLYFCGYTSLQFAIRHAFHMSFIPYFFAALFFQQLGSQVLRLTKKNCSNTPQFASSFRKFTSGCGRTVGWLLLILSMTLVPLYWVRMYQERTVRALMDSYARSSRVTIPYRQEIWNNRCVFIPLEGRNCGLCQNMGMIVDIETRHIAASFANVNEPLDICMVYEWEGLPWDFSAPCTYHVKNPHEPLDFDYFFPVHETTTCKDWNHFVGISLPKEQAHFFQGFAQVSNLNELGPLINMIVPKQKDRFIPSQQLNIPWTGSEWTNYSVHKEFNPVQAEMEIKELLKESKNQEALERVEQVLVVRPRSIRFTFLLAEILQVLGETKRADQECLALLEYYPNAFVLYARLDRYFEEHGGVEGKVKGWTHVLKLYPHLNCASIYLKDAQNQVELHQSACKTYTTSCPLDLKPC